MSTISPTQSANNNRVSEAVLARRRAIAERQKPSSEVLFQQGRLKALEARRPDWDGTPDAANDNVGWPLARALRIEGNLELLRIAVRYRQIERDATDGCQLMGLSPTADLGLDRESKANEDGSITFGKVRKSSSANAAASTPGRRSKSTARDDGTTSHLRSSNVQRKWTGDDKLNARIDASRILAELRAAVGAFAGPLEALVVEGETYEQVGRSAGIGNRAGAIGYGRGVAHQGLLAAKDVFARYTLNQSRTPKGEGAVNRLFDDDRLAV